MKDVNTFIQQWHSKLVKRDSKDNFSQICLYFFEKLFFLIIPIPNFWTVVISVNTVVTEILGDPEIGLILAKTGCVTFFFKHKNKFLTNKLNLNLALGTKIYIYIYKNTPGYSTQSSWWTDVEHHSYHNITNSSTAGSQYWPIRIQELDDIGFIIKILNRTTVNKTHQPQRKCVSG